MNNNRATKDLIIQARKEVLSNKNLPKALSFLGSIDQSSFSNDNERLLFYNTLALTYLENGQYKESAEIYRNIGEKYNAGFCELLMGNEAEAEKLWLSEPESSPCQWGKCLLNFINLKKSTEPSYLQIRNHLEIDMGYFIEANKLKYAENLMKNDDIFISINLESYKLIGKVLLNYGFLNMARKYLLKSLDTIPFDSETLYFLGQYNYKIGAYKESKNIIEKCLECNYHYIPAQKLMKKLELKLNSGF